MNFEIWFLFGVALVFFMQCGFAMLEVGFIRSKNTANIIMKNLMDLGFGAISFLLLGYCLLAAEDYIAGLIGVPNLNIITDFSNFNYSDYIFNLVFCATAATIVSGAMAERTKFTAYCIYSVIISAVIYPIEAGWVWNEKGWLNQMGFLDFAGSGAIHMVGGICAFVGAALVGPRIGKYLKNGKVNAIPGHNITISALGVFILWFGWYGFNGAAAGNTDQLGSIFTTTTIAACSGLVTAMIFSKIKNGKPDLSMSLNGALGGLVGITAGCAYVDAAGALVIGIISGILVILAIEFIDFKLKVDDPVGAVAVHGVCGFWGAIAVGFFAVDGGLAYGGGINLLKVQAIGVGAIALWTFATISLSFFLIKKIHGLRATLSMNEELAGLDVSELGTNNHSNFLKVTKKESSSSSQILFNDSTLSRVENKAPVKISRVVVITRKSRLDVLTKALNEIDVYSMTVTDVFGCKIINKEKNNIYRGVSVVSNLLPRIKIEIVVCKVPVSLLISTIKKALYTGVTGDGKIFVSSVDNVFKIRTGEAGYDALQDKVVNEY